MTAAAPRLWLETEPLTAVAAHLHAQRVALYPAAIERGAIGEGEAADGIRIMAAIVHDWRRKLAAHLPILDPSDPDWCRYLTLAPPPPAEATDAEKVDTLTKATARAAQLRERQPPHARDDYAEYVAALLWWHEPEAPGPGALSRIARHRLWNDETRDQYADRWRALGWVPPLAS